MCNVWIMPSCRCVHLAQVYTEENAVKKPQPYKPMWGGGDATTPITPEEIIAHHDREKWPAYDYVVDANQDQSFSPANDAVDFDKFKAMGLWGTGRWARNIPRWIVDEHRFDIIASGIWNYMSLLPRDDADSGNVLLLVSGGPRCLPDFPVTHFAFLVTGMRYSPHVFDITNNCFKLDQHQHMALEELELQVPFDLKICERRCRITPKFEALDHQTSDELVLALTSRLSTMKLSVLQHEVVDDGTLMVSRVTEIQELGMLWDENTTRALFHDVVNKSSSDSLATGLKMSDPLAPKKRSRPTPGKQGQRAGGSGEHGQATSKSKPRPRGASGAGPSNVITSGEPETPSSHSAGAEAEHEQTHGALLELGDVTASEGLVPSSHPPGYYEGCASPVGQDGVEEGIAPAADSTDVVDANGQEHVTGIGAQGSSFAAGDFVELGLECDRMDWGRAAEDEAYDLAEDEEPLCVRESENQQALDEDALVGLFYDSEDDDLPDPESRRNAKAWNMESKQRNTLAPKT